MIETQTVRRRADAPAGHTWDLAAVYPDTAAWEADVDRVRGLLLRAVELQGGIRDADSLLTVLGARDEVSLIAERLYVYARLLRDSDGSNAEAQALDARAGALYAEVAAAYAWVGPEILAHDPAEVRGWMEVNRELAPYRYALELLLREREHVRSAEVESVLAQLADVTRAPGETYDVFTNTDLVLPTISGPDGEPLQLTLARYGTAMTNPDRRFRRDAFDGVFGAYGTYRNTLASTLGGTVRDHVIRARVHGYPSALEAALAPNDVPVEVYTNLLSTVGAHLDRLHRYVGLRRRILGLDTVHPFDLRAPLFPEGDRVFTYPEAGRLIGEALEPLGQEYLDAVDQILGNRWIDVYENAGKRSGAYSGGMYTTPPYILLNYQERLDDVYTLAHEMGHSVHSYLTRRSQPYPTGEYTIFVAEVASTLNEALLTDYLLRTLDDVAIRRELVVQQLEALRSTFFRQTSFAEFELDMHRQVEAGGALTAEWLSERYGALLRRFYGPGLTAGPEASLEWSYIPHFYMNFYVYQYATGISAALALAAAILDEGVRESPAGSRPAVERYLTFLRAGSSQGPIELLRDAGVDMTTPAPIEQAIARFDRLLDDLEALTPPG